jgi:hypothetical protein
MDGARGKAGRWGRIWHALACWLLAALMVGMTDGGRICDQPAGFAL